MRGARKLLFREDSAPRLNLLHALWMLEALVMYAALLLAQGIFRLRWTDGQSIRNKTRRWYRRASRKAGRWVGAIRRQARCDINRVLIFGGGTWRGSTGMVTVLGGGDVNEEEGSPRCKVRAVAGARHTRDVLGSGGKSPCQQCAEGRMELLAWAWLAATGSCRGSVGGARWSVQARWIGGRRWARSRRWRKKAGGNKNAGLRCETGHGEGRSEGLGRRESLKEYMYEAGVIGGAGAKVKKKEALKERKEQGSSGTAACYNLYEGDLGLQRPNSSRFIVGKESVCSVDGLGGGVGRVVHRGGPRFFRGEGSASRVGRRLHPRGTVGLDVGPLRRPRCTVGGVGAVGRVGRLGYTAPDAPLVHRQRHLCEEGRIRLGELGKVCTGFDTVRPTMATRWDGMLLGWALAEMHKGASSRGLALQFLAWLIVCMGVVRDAGWKVAKGGALLAGKGGCPVGLKVWKEERVRGPSGGLGRLQVKGRRVKRRFGGVWCRVWRAIAQRLQDALAQGERTSEGRERSLGKVKESCVARMAREKQHGRVQGKAWRGCEGKTCSIWRGGVFRWLSGACLLGAGVGDLYTMEWGRRECFAVEEKPANESCDGRRNSLKWAGFPAEAGTWELDVPTANGVGNAHGVGAGGYRGVRVGEAKTPGPYVVGGASSSGQGMEVGALAGREEGVRNPWDVSERHEAQGNSLESGRKKRRMEIARSFDHAGEEDPFQVLEAELDNGQRALGVEGGVFDGEAFDAENELMAMQARQMMDGDMAALQGGMHEIDDNEFFTAGKLGDEAMAHSCGVAIARVEGEADEMGLCRSWEEGTEEEEYAALMECYTISGAKKLGMSVVEDSPLLQDGYIGRESDEPLLEEEIRIMKGRMPRALALFDILNECTDKEAGNRLGAMKDKGGFGRSFRKEEKSQHEGKGVRSRKGLGEGFKGREVFQGPMSAPPTIEEENVGVDASTEKQQACVQAYNAKDATTTIGESARSRGRRQRGEATCEVVMINSSGAPQLYDTVYEASRRKGRVAVIMNQEHLKNKYQTADMQAKLKSMRWRAAMAPATLGSGGGNSAGVAILSPLHVSCGRLREREDISPAGSEGRLVMAWVQKIVPCGFVAISAYLYTCEGPSPRNVHLLARALQAARESESPWIVGADFQDGPEALKGWAGKMVERAGGRWAYAEEPTIYPSTGCPRTIDYFIVSDKLAPFVDTVRVFDEVSTSPHRALLATFKNRSKPIVQWTLRTPRRFPRVKPMGCARHPVAPHDGFLKEMRDAETKEEVKGVLGAAWKDLALAVETEICGVTDRYTQDGPDRKCCGRGDGSRYVEAPMLPARAMGEWGRLDMESYRLLWSINRLGELASLARISKDGGRLTKGQSRQWEVLVKKVGNVRCPMLSMKEGAQQWRVLAVQLKNHANEPWETVDLLESSVDWATGLLEAKRKKHKQVVGKSWWKWVGEQFAAGGGALHKLVKRQSEQLDDVVEVEGRLSASAQDIVDLEIKGWKNIWCRPGIVTSAPWRREWSDGQIDTLTRPTVEEFRTAASKFKVWTGMGTDTLPPRVWGWLSDQLIARAIEFLEGIEGVGMWPYQLEEALVHLIPKGGGGKRPIGLICSLPRIWARVRRRQVREWREEHFREYNWMSKGRGARRAVWVQSVMEEAARQRGISSGAVLIDLIKAFDHLLLKEVWSAGLLHGFPVVLLRLSLECSTFKRRLVFRGACSHEAVETLGAVLPGLEHSTDFMLLALMGPLDKLLCEHQGLSVFVIADDTKIGAMGGEEEVTKRLCAATHDLIEDLEKKKGMRVSRNSEEFRKGKTIALVSCNKLGMLMKHKMGKLGISICKGAKNLGVDFATGKGRSKRSVLEERDNAARKKMARVVRLGKKAAPWVIRSGLMPSVSYGVEVTGVTDGMLMSWRTMIARGYGSIGGRSITARLALEGTDPGKQLVVEAIMCWVEAWWDELMPREEMRSAWRYAIKSVGMAARPNAEVRGGAGAFFAALRRLGWVSPAPEAVRTRGGITLYYGEGVTPEGCTRADPRAVKRWVAEEYEIAAAVHSQVARDINDMTGVRGYPRAKGVPEGSVDRPAEVFGGSGREGELAASWRRARFDLVEGGLVPWFGPATRVIRGLRKSGQGKIAGSLRACMEGGWLTQRKLWTDGRAATDRCSCGKESGTLWHKLAVCAQSEGHRETAGRPRNLKELIKQGKALVWDPLFSRGVPARPKCPPPPKAQRWWKAEVPDAVEIATGDVYTDGSALGLHWRATRAGWASVAVSEDGRVLWTAGGVCDEPHASILRAELRAVLETLKIAVVPICIHVDNATVVKGFEEGKEWCTSSGREGADLWRDIWECMKDVGVGVKVVKVAAHTTWWDVLWGKISARNRGGNDLADKEAKRALKEALRSSPTAGYNASWARAIGWAKWIAWYAAGWVVDTVQDEAGEGRVAGGREETQRTTMGHELWEMGDLWVCRRCGRQSEQRDARRALKSSPCGGCAGGRAIAHATGNRNYVWNRHALSTAGLLEQGARLVQRSGIPDSMIDGEKIGELEGSYAEKVKHSVRGWRDGGRTHEVAYGAREEGGDGLWRRPWEEDPQWLYLPHLRGGEGQQRGGVEGSGTEEAMSAADAEKVQGGGHWMRVTGGLVWCSRCACFAHKRHGVGLKGVCAPSARGAVKARLARLHTGKHPITGGSLLRGGV